jgi:hypothetical protein
MFAKQNIPIKTTINTDKLIFKFILQVVAGDEINTFS